MASPDVPPPAARVAAAPTEPAAEPGRIQVLRPRLPAAERLLPYLRRIDAARVYTNYGPLVTELEARLAARFGLPANALASASSGTAGLVGAILAVAGRAGPQRPLALVPDYTFVATAVAAEQCGFQPHFGDVGDDWMLDPERLASHPQRDRIGVVVPVAPYGRPVPQAPWLRFRERTGIPVVIDAAAAFETVGRVGGGFLGALPVVLSFHATKSYATGEGGAVLSTDAALVADIAQALNFGFRFDRNSRVPSTNGKLSEYHAAIGLAELDGWEDKARAFAGVVAGYRRAFEDAGLAERVVLAPEIASCYCLLACRDAAEAAAVEASLDRADIGHRLWYGAGLRRQTQYAAAAHDPLDATEALAPRVLGLPMACDLDAAARARVVDAVRRALAGTA